MSEPVSRLDLELLALGELGESAESMLRGRIADDPDLAERFARIERDLTRERELPALVLPVEAPKPAGFPRWASLGGLALVLAAAVALFVLRPQTPETPTYRGALDLELVRIRLGEPEVQGALVKARAGDRLQYTVQVPESGVVSVFDVQDDGTVSVWSDALPVSAGRPAQGAVVIDDYPGLERVYFVFAAERVDPADFESALVEAWSAPLAELDVVPGLKGVSQRSVMLLEDP
ncbi:MAG: hypothetical protein R3F61_12610 [Myxococcota bacterium]